MNHYPRHIGDWIRDTAHLSEVEECMYSRMIDQYYSRERPLPADKAGVCRLVRAVSREARKAVDVVLGEFFTLEDDGWHQKRCDAELAKYTEKSAKARASAAVSVAVRRGEIPSKGLSQRPEWALLVDVCGSRCVKCGAPGPLERDHIVPTYQGGADELENWQPLCRSCNAGKGSETIDHRPKDWRFRFAERQKNERSSVRSSVRSNERSTNHQPIANSQEPENPVVKPPPRTTDADQLPPLPDSPGGIADLSNYLSRRGLDAALLRREKARATMARWLGDGITWERLDAAFAEAERTLGGDAPSSPQYLDTIIKRLGAQQSRRSIHDERADTIAALTGANRRPAERDITGVAERVD